MALKRQKGARKRRWIWVEPGSGKWFDRVKHTLIYGDSLELMLSDRVDGTAANALEVEVLAAIKQGHKAIYVNLAQATFLCSAGLRVLLQYHRQMKAKGLTLLVTRPSTEASAALEMTGFPELVEK